jgi:hypothetical protein
LRLAHEADCAFLRTAELRMTVHNIIVHRDARRDGKSILFSEAGRTIDAGLWMDP